MARVITPSEALEQASQHLELMSTKLAEYIEYINMCIVKGLMSNKTQIQIDKNDFMLHKISCDLDVVTVFSNLEKLYSKDWNVRYEKTIKNEHILFIDIGSMY